MLTALDRRRLTLFTWCYHLESEGFTPLEARRLVLLRLLVDDGRLES